LLRLAAFMKKHRADGVRLQEISENVPGYEAKLDSEGRFEDPQEWEALRKRVRRDLQHLADVFGIGCRYDDEHERYFVEPPFFTDDERRHLVAAAALVRVDGLGDAELAALGSAVDEHGQRVVMRVHRHVLALREALAARRPVTFRYRGQERVFDPWAVGLWRDHWYTVGYAHNTGERRVYRLDRIEERDDGSTIDRAGPDASYHPPDEFDAQQALLLDPNMWGHDPPVVARVRVERDWVTPFVREFGGEATPAPAGDGAASVDAVVTLTVRHYESFRDRLFAFGTHAVLLDPPELVEYVRSWLSEVR
jgi:predicted DNA-binding transcriptional regulator YafY